MTKLFISATTADLASARACAKRGLETVNYEVVEQNTFETDYGTMLERLERKIAACDGIVHIAGYVYGAEPDPSTLPPGAPRRSYTQWEYHLAKKIQSKRKGFKIYAFLTADEYPATASAEPQELRNLQLEHRALLSPIKSSKRIVSDAELEEKVKEIQLAFERERRLRRLLQTALALLVGAIVVIALGGGFSQHACQAPGVHSLCKHYGWGGVPTLAQEAEFRDAAARGCEGLRLYALREDVPLVLRDKAERAVQNPQVRQVDTWVQQPEVPMPITLDLLQAPPAGDEAAAVAASRAAVMADAEQRCRAPLATSLYRLPESRPLARLEVGTTQCERAGTQWRCALQTNYVCQADVKSNNEEKTCHAAP